MRMTYIYRAIVEQWVDADTVRLTVDVGFNMDAHVVCSLHGVDVPAQGQHGHSDAVAMVNTLAPAGTRVLIHTYRPADDSAHWLAVIDTETCQINEQIITSNIGVPCYTGAKAIHH